MQFSEVDFRITTNSTVCYDNEVLDHVTKKYTHLKQRQNELSLGKNDEKINVKDYIKRLFGY